MRLVRVLEQRNVPRLEEMRLAKQHMEVCKNNATESGRVKGVDANRDRSEGKYRTEK